MKLNGRNPESFTLSEIGFTNIEAGEEASFTDRTFNNMNQVVVNTGTGYTVTNGTKKNVGTYTATVRLDSNYQWKSGSKRTSNISLKCTIKPRKAVTPELRATGRTKLKVSWSNRDRKIGISGYRIQYSTSKNFTAKTTKTINVPGKNATSRNITGLKRNTRYYVRI